MMGWTFNLHELVVLFAYLPRVHLLFFSVYRLENKMAALFGLPFVCNIFAFVSFGRRDIGGESRLVACALYANSSRWRSAIHQNICRLLFLPLFFSVWYARIYARAFRNRDLLTLTIFTRRTNCKRRVAPIEIRSWSPSSFRGVAVWSRNRPAGQATPPNQHCRVSPL